ncbi:MAG: hypothetical protein CME63_17195 [Halobacteriovoraceae bacterium]|nr:hypothetical protein [Halobacteriovoraceae bacterium]
MTNQTTAIIFQIQSFLILSLILIGVYFRKHRKTHIKFMLTAIIWDILLILQIELNRSAIAKASKAVSNTMILNIHVSLAVLTVLFYFAMLYTGKKFIGGDSSIRPLHRKLGWTTVALRILTFATSFFAVSAPA